MGVAPPGGAWWLLFVIFIDLLTVFCSRGWTQCFFLMFSIKKRKMGAFFFRKTLGKSDVFSLWSRKHCKLRGLSTLGCTKYCKLRGSRSLGCTKYCKLRASSSLGCTDYGALEARRAPNTQIKKLFGIQEKLRLKKIFFGHAILALLNLMKRGNFFNLCYWLGLSHAR